MSNVTFPILNPETPLAFLPPSIALQLEVSRYIYTASLGAFIWDLLIHSGQDYQLLFKHKLSLTTFTYFFSRIASLAYIITSTVFQLGAVGNCQSLQVALGWCFAAAIPSTSFLFFLRIRAVFAEQKLVIGIFGIIWLAVLGGCITVPFAIEGGHIGPTSRCVNTAVKPFSSTGIIVSAANDTLVLIAISLKFAYSAAIDDSLRARVKTIWGGQTLPRLSRTLLQSGQQYYLITVSGNILTMAMILSPAIPPVYRAMFTIPNTAIENAMACKVFRDIKLGVIQTNGNASTFSRTTGGTPAIFHRYRRNQHSGPLSDQSTKFSSYATASGGANTINILKSVDKVTSSSTNSIPLNLVNLNDAQDQSSIGRKASDEYPV